MDDVPYAAFDIGLRAGVPTLATRGFFDECGGKEFVASLLALQAIPGGHAIVDLSGVTTLPDWVLPDLERLGARLRVAGRELVTVMRREDAACARRRAFPHVIFETAEQALVFIRRRDAALQARPACARRWPEGFSFEDI